MNKRSYKILVVEPNDNWYFTIFNTLDKDNHKVFRAKTGLDVLDICKKKQIDLLIVEQSLPDMDGIEITTEIRDDQDLKLLPIIFFSEVSDKYTQIAAFEAGADIFLWKGMKNRLFQAQVNALLRRCCDMSEPEIELKKFGEIEIDEEKVLVYRNGEALELSKKEFQLLLLLTSKPGKVFKRPNILNMMWGDDIIVGDRNIDTHIKKLRKKIGKEYIKTARGIGYKFVHPELN